MTGKFIMNTTMILKSVLIFPKKEQKKKKRKFLKFNYLIKKQIFQLNQINYS